MTVIYSWNHVPDKRIERGEIYKFVENMRKPNKTNIYKAEVLEVASEAEDIRMELQVKERDNNERYQQEQEITRIWHKQDSHSGTTLIYKS